MPVKFKIKRVYDEYSKEDGIRILVDRLWPRGVTKAEAHLDRWAKELAPSSELRERFHHDPALWDEFCEAYSAELKDKSDKVEELVSLARRETVTLVYAAKDERHNNAVALKSILEGLRP